MVTPGAPYSLVTHGFFSSKSLLGFLSIVSLTSVNPDRITNPVKVIRNTANPIAIICLIFLRFCCRASALRLLTEGSYLFQ